jgi:hypothetical protein
MRKNGQKSNTKSICSKNKNEKQKKRRSIFSQRKKNVVHTTTLVLKCHFRVGSNTFESFIA